MFDQPVIDPRMASEIARAVAGSGMGVDTGTMPDRGTLSRPSRVSNGRGGWTAGTPEVIAESIPYRRESATGKELVQGAQIESVGMWRLTFAVGTDVRATDTFTDDEDGSVYQVQFPLDPQSYSVETAVLATRTV